MAEEVKVKTYRVAVSDDEAGILKVFAEVAPEVPTAVRDGTKDLIHELVESGKSLVAVDAASAIVGYALAAPHDHETLSLVYLGVSKAARNQHVATDLVSKLKESGARILTDVRPDNKSSMVERFKHFGFVKIPTVFEGTKLRWDKPKDSPPAAGGLSSETPA